MYSSDLFLASNGKLVYYNSQTANTPYKAGMTQATEGVAITMGDWGSFLTVLAIPKGGQKLYIYCRSSGSTFDWKEV